MNIATHLKIDNRLCGEPVETGTGFCRVKFVAVSEMAADDAGLVHGGFIFGLADYAAMVAVNDPNVVLGGADVRFLKPVSVGDEIFALARVKETQGKKRMVTVAVARGEESVFEGEFVCFVLDKHVLDQ
jgi:acyl-coenzyme A thioesterase PaaI-like protein